MVLRHEVDITCQMTNVCMLSWLQILDLRQKQERVVKNLYLLNTCYFEYLLDYSGKSVSL